MNPAKTTGCAASLILASAMCAGWMLSGIPGPFGWQTRYDDARLLQCLSLLLMLGFTLAQPRKLLSAVYRNTMWMRLCVFASFAFGMLSLARSNFPGYALIDIAFTAALLQSGFVLCEINRESRNRLANPALLIAASGAMLLGLHFGAEMLAATITGDALQLEYSWIPFINPRYFAKAATFALPLLWLAPFLTSKSYRSIQISSAIAAVLIWSQLLGSGSRGALLGMAAGIIIAGAFFGRIGRSYAFTQTVFAAAGLLLWSVFVWVYHITAPERIATTSLSGRGDLYRAAIADIQGNPLLGIGPMHYSEIGRHPATSVAGPHDFPLQLAAEWGLPAALLMLGALLGFFWTLFKLTRQKAISHSQFISQSHIRVAIFCALSAALLHALFANVANEPISQTLAILLAGLFPFEQSNPGNLSPDQGASSLTRMLMACIVLAIGGGLILAVNKGWNCVGHPDEIEYSRGLDGSIYPRLWSQGLIPLEQSCHSKPTPE